MNDHKRIHETTSRVEGRELVIERIFDAPRELVFKVFTDPDHLENWWGPEGWTTTNYKTDIQPGGVWHFCMRSSDGQESWGKALYHEIDVPERIVYTDVFSNEEGNTVESMPEMLVTLTFIEYKGKTKIVNRTRFASEKQLESIIDMGVVQGFTEMWNCLEKHLQTIQRSKQR
ncbi:SRPBCC domain-containing protein [Sediminibacillus dalangtanensis]|uniref:SRPBCC domain-containing protein n=1 Tax=Sediminibacillus dalangtanensis TaxID=2729421 RepID=A0ABX7VTL4_9BACI|nr:SRPBCC domain-containing protein [Sediminibacillus dalangtanensis]QTN00308.1 SRPBCC domain-containing protein [Sediminibacillus dalangtanensis]